MKFGNSFQIVEVGKYFQNLGCWDEGELVLEELAELDVEYQKIVWLRHFSVWRMWWFDKKKIGVMIIDIEFGIFKIFRKCLKTIKKIALLTTING